MYDSTRKGSNGETGDRDVERHRETLARTKRVPEKPSCYTEVPDKSDLRTDTDSDNNIDHAGKVSTGLDWRIDRSRVYHGEREREERYARRVSLPREVEKLRYRVR